MQRLLDQGRFADVLAAVGAIPEDDPAFPAAVVLRARCLLEQAQVDDAANVLDRAPATAFVATDGAIAALWRAFLRAYVLPRAGPGALATSVDEIDTGTRSTDPRVRATALGLRGRLIRIRVLYAELPLTATRLAAEDFARAAAEFRRLGAAEQAWSLTGLRCAALIAAPRDPVGPALSVVEELVRSTSRAGAPLAEADARLRRLEIRTRVALDGADEARFENLAAECEAIGELLDGAGHSFGTARAQWTLISVLLEYGAADVVAAAHECADAFLAAGAPHREQEVLRALETFHTRRGEGAQRRAVVGRLRSTGSWHLLSLTEAIGRAELHFRTGQLDRGRVTLEAALAQAPQRSGRVALRSMLAAQLTALGLIADARAVLAAVLDDLAAVAPSAWSAEAFAQLAQAEWTSDLPAALSHATDAVEVARRWGSPAELCRYLSMRAQLRMMARQAAGRHPVLSVEADADLVEATSAGPGTMELTVALIGAHEARGQALFFDGDLDGSIRVLGDAEHLARLGGFNAELAFVSSHLGLVALAQARELRTVAGYEVAIDALAVARERFILADATQWAWRPHFLIGAAQREAARWEADPDEAGRRLAAAEARLEEAAADIDVLRGAAGGTGGSQRQHLGIAFGGDKQQVYQQGLALAVDDLSDPALAIRWLERMKSRALLDALATATLPAGRAPLLDRERELLDRRTTAESFAELQDIHRELAAVLDGLAADPVTAGYAALRRSDPPAWPEVRAALARERSAYGRRIVVAQFYAEGDDVRLFGMAADWDAPRSVRIPVSGRQLADFARSTFRASGGVRMMMQDSADGGLGDWHRFGPLVEPIAGWTDPDDVVYLIPHNGLHDLPLHTLPAGAGLPLGLRNPVCYAPSLSVLLHILGRPSPAARPAAVFGDPGGGLPWAAAEADAVAATLGASAVRGPGATRAAVLTGLRSAGTVHLACHARASIDDGLDSSVELADGDLRAGELLALRIGADLVVLSGCETGVSEHRPGDEAVGLVRALLHGGVRAVITSQWRVRDESAQRLLTAFHELDATAPRADALRSAMQAQADRHFYHWGGFVLVGDWR